ncbi:helix-turn-helix transcriptional regulator [Pseudomonas putida]|uniref:Helix-turn-helix transcriptional regulator n=1 Tax=Pseudomonas putida TaxID=303 RepID=A0A6I6Y5D6_PSEPU|nr:helix-turn-helix transcriptional regulator [Pseudomonas putida]MBH3449178.1 helix-turn-helix transcriptional regulator [Pseudomonas putida]QHG66805.1 helix-turn-helix transcriptional regulator [Pseudomonas putida]
MSDDPKKVSLADTGIETRIAAVANLYETRKQAALTAGVAMSSLSRWIAGEGMPAFDSLAALAAARGVSLDWIATGKGEMCLADTETPEGVRSASAADYAYIPLYDAYISQGHGAWNEGARVLAMLAFTRYSLRKKGLEPKQLAAVRVDGDSNEPELSEGDTVMVDLSRNHFQGEAFYVIRLNDLLYAKRLQREFDGSMSVISANSAYHPVRIPVERLDSLEIVGRVVWAGGWMI